MKITKRAKKVKVKWIEIEQIVKRSEYQCPYCRTVYQNTLSPNITRFKCDCGQELIVQ